MQITIEGVKMADGGATTNTCGTGEDNPAKGLEERVTVLFFFFV